MTAMAAERAPAIVAEGISRSFGRVRALEGLSFAVDRGQVVGLLGHNGAGKTTTIRILNGLIAPDAGRARVRGFDPTVDGAAVRAGTGVLTETPSLDERLTARENLRFFGQLYGVASDMVGQRVDDLLDQFELGARGGDRVAGFSRGMKQRLALARALIHDPELLFLDEPTAALDPVAARGVHELIRRFAADERRTVVLTTHNLVEAQRLCDRVFILRQGRLIAHGTPTELARQLGVRSTLVIEVEPEQIDGAAQVLGQAGFEVSLQPAGVLSVDGVARADIPRLVERLVAAGLTLYRLDASEPTLEDAYFALHHPPSGTAE